MNIKIVSEKALLISLVIFSIASFFTTAVGFSELLSQNTKARINKIIFTEKNAQNKIIEASIEEAHGTSDASLEILSDEIENSQKDKKVY